MLFKPSHSAPVVLVGSRLLFIIYFALIFGAHVFEQGSILTQRIPLNWAVYLLVLYLGSEHIYATFLKRGVDLTFAFPILFSVFTLNAVSMFIRGQESVPIVNRAEHFTSFVLLAYIVWIFFLKYLPHTVWDEHPYYTAILVLAITSLAGATNEIVELFFDQAFGTAFIGEGFDTSLDLLMNTLGAGLLLAVQLILRAGNITFSR